MSSKMQHLFILLEYAKKADKYFKKRKRNGKKVEVTSRCVQQYTTESLYRLKS